MLSLLACHTIEKLPVDLPDEELFVPVFGGDLCAGEIAVARAGTETSVAVLADAHAEVYGTVTPDPFHVHLSWAMDPSTTMSLVWRTDAETLASRVEIGTTETYGTATNGRSFLIGGDPANGRAHEVHLCGLTPGTTYHYRVGGEASWSPDRTFTTAPPPGEPAAFRFGVAGDSRGDPATWGAILDAMDAQAPDFYVFTGDAVSVGTNVAEWGAWLDAGYGHIDHRPVMMAHGNHEFLAQPYFALFAQPDNEQWFSLDYAQGHFAFLNETVGTAGAAEVQADWLADDLAATEQLWRFTAHHMPAYSSCVTHGSNAQNRALWSPVMEAGGVVMDFAGHNHNYERSVPLLGGVETAAELGTTYVVAAGAGAPLYSNEMENAFTAVAVVTEHYVMVEVSGSQLTLTAYDLAGNVLDSFSTTR